MTVSTLAVTRGYTTNERNASSQLVVQTLDNTSSQHKNQRQKGWKAPGNTADMDGSTFSFHYLTEEQFQQNPHYPHKRTKYKMQATRDVTKPCITKNWSALPFTRALFSVVWDCRVKRTLANPLRFVI